MSRNIPTMTVQELVDQRKGPIWVLNTSHQAEAGLGGDVFVTISVNNQNRPMKVPRTWIPVELTKLFPRKFLLDSPNFLEALSKGLITAIPDEYARKLIADPGYKDEERRLAEIEAAIREASQIKGVGRNVTVSSGDAPEEEPTGVTSVKRKNVSVVAIGADDEEDDKSTVSARFVGWVNKLNSMEDEKAARNEIRIRGELEEEEAHYLYENTIYPKIKRSLAKTLGRD